MVRPCPCGRGALRETLHDVENDPRRRRPRGRRAPRDAQKPTRPPAQPRPPGIRGGPGRDPGQPRAARRGEPARGESPRAEVPGRTGRDARGARAGRSQRSRSRPAGGQAGPRDPSDLKVGTPCLIVLDCRDGEPDRSGATATFEGFFDLETGEPRRPGTGYPRLRVIAPAPPSPAQAPALDGPSAADRPVSPDGSPDEPPATPPVPAHGPLPAPVERLWGFECWWRPDPTRAGLTLEDHTDLEHSKKLLRGLLRDTRRAGRSLQPR